MRLHDDDDALSLLFAKEERGKKKKLRYDSFLAQKEKKRGELFFSSFPYPSKEENGTGQTEQNTRRGFGGTAEGCLTYWWLLILEY